MSAQRDRLETEVAEAKERIKNIPANTPLEIRKEMEEELIQMEFDLNNFVDEDDNND